MPHSVNLVSGNNKQSDEQEGYKYLDNSFSESVEEWDHSDSLVRSAFQVLKKRQRPPPKQYYFPISDKETKLGKAPPLPCKVCSSPRHCDKECPHWEMYLK